MDTEALLPLETLEILQPQPPEQVSRILKRSPVTGDLLSFDFCFLLKMRNVPESENQDFQIGLTYLNILGQFAGETSRAIRDLRWTLRDKAPCDQGNSGPNDLTKMMTRVT